jgi:sugar diacid utilization regulator
MQLLSLDAPPATRRRLQNLRQIADAVNATSDLNAVFERIVFAVCHHTGWWSSGIMAVNRASGYSELVTRYGPPDETPLSLPTRWPLETSPSRLVVDHKQPIIIPDAQTSSAYPEYRLDALARGYRTVVLFPLNVTDAEGRELAFAVHARQCVDVDEEELDFLATIAHLGAIAVNKAKSLKTERMFSARLQRTLDLNATLFARVLAGVSMAGIATIVESTLLHPLIIIDFTSDEFYIGRSPEPGLINERRWAELVRGKLAKELFGLVQRVAPSEFRQLYALDLASAGIAVTRSVHAEPLKVDDETVGGIILFPKPVGLDDFDFLAAQEATFALSAQLIRGHVAFRQLASELSDLFERVIEGAWSNEKALRSRAAQLGVDLNQTSQLFVVSHVRAGEQASDGVALLRVLNRTLKQHAPSAVVVAIGQEYLMRLVCGADGIPEKRRERLIATLANAVHLETGGDALIVEGPMVSSIGEYPAAFEACQRLMALAHMFDRKGWIRQRDFGPFALLISALDDKAVPGFIGETVGVIKTYDQKHGTALLETIATFNDSGCRYQAAANQLGIHVSTLRYRLSRLEELFSIDFTNPETRFALSLAIRLDNIREGRV